MAPYEVSKIIDHAFVDSLSDAEKVHFLEKSWLDHLEHGPQKAPYTNKTIQNEVIAVMANLIRDYFCQCLEKCPHFSLIADETTAHGRENLSGCLPFLDFVEDPCCPIKREVLIDLCDLTRTTEKAIATALTESLKKHKIDIANC